MRRTIPALLLCACLFSGLGAQNLVMGAGDDKTRGAIRIFNDIVAEIGYTATAEVVPSGRSIERANEGVLDGELLRVESAMAHKPNMVKIGIPMATLRLVVYGKIGSPGLKNPNAIVGKKVAVNRNSIAATVLTASSTQVFLHENEQSLRMVEAGRVDYAVLVEESSSSVFRELGFSDLAKGETPYAELVPYNWLNEKHAAPVPKIEAVMKKWQADGRLKKRVDEYTAGL